MVEKLLQCLRLLALVLACYGWIRFWMRRFRLPVELALPVSLSALGLALFAAGCLGLLLPVSWLLLALGVALAGCSLWKREPLRPIFTPGLLLWLLLCGLALYLVFGQVFYYIDNFSHWATAVKVLLANDAFPTAADYHIYFPQYPLGSSVLVYWLARMAGINSEWFQMLSQAVLIAACLSAPLALAPRGKKAGWAWALWTVFALCVVGCNIELTSLYVDNLMPLIGLAGVSLWLYGREEKGLFLPLMVFCCYVVTVKQSGIFFAAVLILLALLDSPERKSGLKQAAGLIAAVAAVKLLWSWHTKRAFGLGSAGAGELSLAGLFPGFADKTGADVSTIIRSMAQTVCRPETLLPVLALLLCALVLSRNSQNRGRFVRLAVIGGAFWLLYCLGQGAMYILFMPRGEAVRLAAFERYFATLQIFTAGYFLLLTGLEQKERELNGRWHAAGLAVLSVLCLLMLAPSPRYFLRTEQRVPCFLAETNEQLDLDWARAQGKPEFWASIRSEFDRVIDQYHIPQGLTYTVFIGQDYSIEVRVLANYLLSSAGTQVCTDAEIEEKGMDCKTFDYYIVLEETEANMAFIRDTFGTADRAGYTY
ncbi:MAG: hypothetical protein ACI4O0_05715 [Candidatus Limivicinus sp.]